MGHGSWQLSEAEELDLRLRKQAERQIEEEAGISMEELRRRIEGRYKQLLAAEKVKQQ